MRRNRIRTKTMKRKILQAMEEVTKFTASFKEFPPRSFPPSFSAATIIEETLESIKEEGKKAGTKP